MANKRINDLQARSDFDATCNVGVDDASQSWRVTGAQIKAFILGAGTVLRANLGVGAIARMTVPTTKTSAYTSTADDDVIPTDATSGAITHTPLAAGSGNKGLIQKWVKTDATFNQITITGIGKLSTQGEAITAYSDGAAWVITDRYIPSNWNVMTMTPAAVTTPYTKGTIVRDVYKWKRIGDAIMFACDYEQSTAGTDGSGVYLFPSPVAFNLTKFPAGGTGHNSVCGFGHYSANGDLFTSQVRPIYPRIYDANYLALQAHGTSGGTMTESHFDFSSAVINFFGLANGTMSWQTCPIAVDGWEG